MAKKKLPKNWLMWAIGILFVMSVMPGEGSKAANQQAIVATQYSCTVDTDCPKCVGGGLIDYNASSSNFLGELSYADCLEGVCQMSDACLIWDCPTGADPSCQSIKQTLLDNTFVKFNDNPMLLILTLGLVVAYFML